MWGCGVEIARISDEGFLVFGDGLVGGGESAFPDEAGVAECFKPCHVQEIPAGGLAWWSMRFGHGVGMEEIENQQRR
jgi:hypothetical protein